MHVDLKYILADKVNETYLGIGLLNDAEQNIANCLVVCYSTALEAFDNRNIRPLVWFSDSLATILTEYKFSIPNTVKGYVDNNHNVYMESDFKNYVCFDTASSSIQITDNVVIDYMYKNNSYHVFDYFEHDLELVLNQYTFRYNTNGRFTIVQQLKK